MNKLKIFSQGEKLVPDDKKNILINDVKPLNPFYCTGCKEFSILNRTKRFQCVLCGYEIECMDIEDIKKFSVDTRRKLLFAIK